VELKIFVRRQRPEVGICSGVYTLELPTSALKLKQTTGYGGVLSANIRVMRQYEV
jgi:hypothetical protein